MCSWWYFFLKSFCCDFKSSGCWVSKISCKISNLPKILCSRVKRCTQECMKVQLCFKGDSNVIDILVPPLLEMMLGLCSGNSKAYVFFTSECSARAVTIDFPWFSFSFICLTLQAVSAYKSYWGISVLLFQPSSVLKCSCGYIATESTSLINTFLFCFLTKQLHV